MSRVINLNGQTVGRWTVISRGPNTTQGQSQWVCQCECGNKKVITGVVLRDKRSQSCGCLKREQTIARSTKHRHSPLSGYSPTYSTWAAMKARCANTKGKNYSHYGGRGIRVCARWHDFRNFLADMGEKPKEMTLDRVNNNGDYEPGNCRWATSKEQARNKRSSRRLTLNGQSLSVADWADRLGIRANTISDRLATGWTAEDALSTPGGTASDNIHCRYLTFKNETRTVMGWARHLNVTPQTLYQRLHRNWPIERVLSR